MARSSGVPAEREPERPRRRAAVEVERSDRLDRREEATETADRLLSCLVGPDGRLRPLSSADSPAKPDLGSSSSELELTTCDGAVDEVRRSERLRKLGGRAASPDAALVVLAVLSLRVRGRTMEVEVRLREYSLDSLASSPRLRERTCMAETEVGTASPTGPAERAVRLSGYNVVRGSRGRAPEKREPDGSS